ncbi:MAG: hypothetical protein NTW08_02750 [Gammaproteobacteria bacterium]|nr:hypothetical protein [Gammaproteobacteria bacterium]
MKAHNTITATSFARNIAAVIDKVRFSGKSIDITKGSQTIVTLVPPLKMGLPINQLEQLFKELPHLGVDEASSMAHDLEQLRRQANIVEDPWE